MICTSTTSYRRRKWQIISPPSLADSTDPSPLLASLSRELQIPPLIARLLLNRGITDAATAFAFLDPKFKDLPTPSLLPNINAAADRIAAAVRKQEKITLYGDYDVDGITGTAMLWHTLTAASANVHTYIPHRVDEGYGLNCDAIQTAIDNGTNLLITIDCGCSALEPIALARRHHIDVIVSDHHEFAPALPDANFIVHPRLPGFTPYPNPDLCGAGVAFKLAWAVAQKLCNAERVNDVYRNLLLEFTALTALGTIADVVPLTGENRILVKHGLAQLARTRLPGLKALIVAAGYHNGEGGKKLDTTAVGFTLAPRINAAGRMGHANEAVELLTTATGQRATDIATQLEAQNKSRQATERKMVDTAKQQLRDLYSISPSEPDAPLDLPHCIVLTHDSFHAGVVGIVASRIVDTHHRPTFVLASDGSPTNVAVHAHGSARSIPGFQLHLAIEHCRDLLTSGGGHAMAGGIKLPLANLAEFRTRIDEFAALHLSEEQLIPALPVDGTITLDECTTRTIALLEKLEPFGRGNPKPRFILEDVRISAPPRRVGATGAHLQLTIAVGPHVHRCIAFKMGALEPQLPVGTHLRLVVEPKLDHYLNTPRVDLQIIDLARMDDEPFDI